MTPSIENPTVRTGQAEGQPAFLIFADNSAEPAGFATYVDRESQGKPHRIFPHTVVKEEFSGQGLASALVKEALDTSIADGFTIVPACAFVRHWVSKHPEYAKHTAQ